jgi:FMN phosphatase YigB (HAD superfamily)
MKYDGAFFDSGGTLFGFTDGDGGGDPSHGEVAAGAAERTTQALRWLGYEVEAAAVAEQLPALSRGWREVGPAWTEETMIEELFRRLQLAPRRDHVVWVTGVCSGPRFESWLFPGVAQTLERLQEAGLYIGLIANTGVPGWVMDRNFRGVGLLPFFHVRVYSGDEGVEKPDPEIFRRAAARAGLEGKRLIYMGDHVDKDVAGAEAAGWASVLFRSSESGSDGRADYEIDTWAELPGLLL